MSRIAIISVNAAADSPGGVGDSTREPSLEKTMNAVATLQQTQQNLDRWTRELSTPEWTVSSYFIRLSFEDVPDLPLRRFLNEMCDMAPSDVLLLRGTIE